MNTTIKEFRSFNRFYTQFVGLLNKRLLESPLSLAEGRVLYEIGATPTSSAADLSQLLGMDKGQLSRILAGLRKRELIERQTGPGGRTPLPLALTPDGEKLLHDLNQMADAQAHHLLRHLDHPDLQRLQEAIQTMRSVLGAREEHTSPQKSPRLRTAQAGELGWIITQHGEIYAQEYGFSDKFEEYVVAGVAAYLNKKDAGSNVWIAEYENKPVGSIAIVKDSSQESQLRWFLVQPHARRLGIGKALMEQAITFSRQAGYAKTFLWTIAHLHSARKLYSAFGFHCVEEKEGTMGDQTVREEKWILEL
ncbi:bifunctional helix-turn-helix transcriptional regulator/GNAT family N-acetyltransferase [Desulfovibrio inopinatus]|uniref:bifunctional helix-turn-helix transcriptional regulator/GNAT family N-acetyltransferase n=1 Tax=Desulfovibrio inopinatus TaxID=102109 RepID=UPI000408CBAF|nr:helix-turn-helix domain-containing GNAT family N-acetyltransferase [Desulfovibrio inopinatus]